MPDNNNPWGRPKRKPSEFDELIQKGLRKLFNMKKKPSFPGGNGGGDNEQPPSKMNFGYLIGLLIILFFAYQSIYQIQPGEQGVVLRFGQYYRVASPGLNFLIPVIEKVVKVDVESIRKEEFGFRKLTSNRFQAGNSKVDLESLMLTADKNVIQINWVVQYKVRDPEHFLFNIENPRAAVRDISESVLRRMVGNRDFNYVLDNREELAYSTQIEMQELLNKYSSGMQIIVVQMLDVNPPDPVRPSFNEVNEADQDKIRLGNEAERTANELLPKALGEAKRMIDEAEGYAIERTNNAEGDVARFNSIYKEYIKAKKVTRTRMYIETMKQVFPSLKEVIMIDSGKSGMLPIINIGAVNEAVKKQRIKQVIDPNQSKN